jgi:hypothetical protein
MRDAARQALVAVLLALCSHSSWGASSDAQVIDVVLTDFAQRSDTMSMHEDGVILVDPATFPWSVERLRLYSLTEREHPKCQVAPNFYQDIVDRNRSAEPLVPLVRPSERWRLMRADEGRALGRILDRSAAAEKIKSVVVLSTPGYSVDGHVAFVLFLFRWSIHGAVAIYLVEQSEGAWRVRCSELLFYP